MIARRQAVFRKWGITCCLVSLCLLRNGGKNIAIYHLSIKIIGRGKGKSAVAAAAYRAGEKITSDFDGIAHDYTKKDGVVHTEILLPNHAPSEYFDRSTLWNSVEKIEKAKNAQLAREIELALPAELSAEQNLILIREYAKQHFVDAGMCADICIHDKKDGNPHAHIMLTMRPFKEDKRWGSKQKKEYTFDHNGNKIYDPRTRQYKCKAIPFTDWNEQTKAEEWRQGWADFANRFLKQNNIAERIDNRSYERQGIEQIPTIHLGVAASAMERKGILTDRGSTNRRIISMNQEMRQLRARISKLHKWLDEEVKAEPIIQHSNTPAPFEDLIYTFSGTLSSHEGKRRWQKITDLKSATTTLAFLQTNNIATLPDLHIKVAGMRSELTEVRAKLKPVERWLTTLDDHIGQAENYKTHKAVHRECKSLKPKQQASFYDAHTSEIILFENAEKYLKEHLNGHNKILLTAWKAEREKLIVQNNVLYQEFYRRKEEVRQAELIQKVVRHNVRVDSKGAHNILLVKKQHETEI